MSKKKYCLLFNVDNRIIAIENIYNLLNFAKACLLSGISERVRGEVGDQRTHVTSLFMLALL